MVKLLITISLMYLKKKKYLGMIQRDSTKIVDVLNTQQATIERLVRKLRKYAKIGEEQLKQIIELQEENRELRKELGDCEKFRYTVFKRLNDEHIKDYSTK